MTEYQSLNTWLIYRHRGSKPPPTFGPHVFRYIALPALTGVPLTCTTLEEIRANIDCLDQQIVTLLAARGHYVSQAVGANPEITEQVYRAMIAAFIQQELGEHAALARHGVPHSKKTQTSRIKIGKFIRLIRNFVGRT